MQNQCDNRQRDVRRRRWLRVKRWQGAPPMCHLIAHEYSGLNSNWMRISSNVKPEVAQKAASAALGAVVRPKMEE